MEHTLGDSNSCANNLYSLREGEQFANAYFDTATKIKIAKALDSPFSCAHGNDAC